MQLTNENYYTEEANKEYCSVSQFKSFYGLNGCEAKAMAEIRGEYTRPKTDALLIGSYVDCALTEPENLEWFKVQHPEMISSRGATKGMLKSEFLKADEMIARVKRDPKFMKAIGGEHQTIMTGNLFGVDFKIKMDSYIPKSETTQGAIVDLKTVESLKKLYYHPTKGKCLFVDYFDYILQGAIYQEIVFQNTGNRLPFYLACVTKEKDVNFDLIWIDDQTLHDRLYGNEFSSGIAEQVNQIRLLKSGEVEPIECGECDYCLPRKKIDKPIHYLELLGELDK